ncbi:IS110 family transposase [Lactobacillus sp. ESL0677]|uniref:IS110 family transposase n=1 Tax=Lactobacillus sp. ESL0677 TaxID=2983208 RepID=UPI0023F671A2|nr:IS110 family transposase [Lactobacillus sp. ESL0677]WEV36314.1 IS110 family transposase [Lactobacillus sp. ESL0677]WEV36683.1 IS110 family transposase [Lactobacillus sp. ESL0677]WEV37115.1 IS110 family transposase [Lactobacillus sp. ESL0677]
MEIVFGIDISSKTFNVAIGIDNSIVKEYKTTNNRLGFKELLVDLKQFEQPEVVFEATGTYSRRLEMFLQDYDYGYIRLNPLDAKKQMDNFRHRKTDIIDARNLALSQFQFKRKNTYQAKPVYQDLKDYNHFYQELNNDVVRTKDRLHSALQLTFPEIETLLSKTDSKLYWNLVKKFPISTIVFEYSIAELKEIVMHATDKCISDKRALKIAEKLSKLANESYPSVDEQSGVVMQVTYFVNQLMQLEQEKAVVIKEMSALSKELPEYEELLSLPGVAATTANEIIAELGDIKRFKRPNQINAYIGIDLKQYESGEYKAARHISKRGNAVARKILYQAVINMVSAATHDSGKNHIADYYQRKKQSYPVKMTKKIAIASIARLIRTIFSLVKNRQQYTYYPTLSK